MARVLCVCGGVAIGRVIAAADMAALETDPQMEPFGARRQAVLAAVNRLRQLGDPDLIEVTAD